LLIQRRKDKEEDLRQLNQFCWKTKSSNNENWEKDYNLQN